MLTIGAPHMQFKTLQNLQKVMFRYHLRWPVLQSHQKLTNRIQTRQNYNYPNSNHNCFS